MERKEFMQTWMGGVHFKEKQSIKASVMQKWSD